MPWCDVNVSCKGKDDQNPANLGTRGTPAAVGMALWAQEEIWMSRRCFVSGPRDHEEEL